MRWLILVLLMSAGLARADGERSGEFDYWVLALSWSPSWCDAEGDARGSPQCDAARDHGWVLHGLWPQYHRGWPAFCPSPHAPPSRSAYDRVVRPPVFRGLTDPVRLPARVVEEAFLQANPEWEADMLTITCRDGRIREARLCLSREMEPVPCGRDVIRDCSLDDARFPPIR